MPASLQPLWLLACLAFHRWALREIHPLHPDVPHIVHCVSELERRLAGQLWLRSPITLRAGLAAWLRATTRALWRWA